MNKQEAIEKINESRLAFAAILSRRNGKSSYFEKELVVMKEEELVDIINQIEPEKPVIPQFVAEWIEVCKEHLTTSLYTAMNPNFMKENSQSFDFILWIKKTSNQDIFARAWLDGYEVEEEKLYTARLNLVTQNKEGYLNKKSEDDSFFIDDLRTYSGDYQTSFTRSELEELNVWDNPAFEIEEVE